MSIIFELNEYLRDCLHHNFCDVYKGYNIVIQLVSSLLTSQQSHYGFDRQYIYTVWFATCGLLIKRFDSRLTEDDIKFMVLRCPVEFFNCIPYIYNILEGDTDNERYLYINTDKSISEGTTIHINNSKWLCEYLKNNEYNVKECIYKIISVADKIREDYNKINNKHSFNFPTNIAEGLDTKKIVKVSENNNQPIDYTITHKDKVKHLTIYYMQI